MRTYKPTGRERASYHWRRCCPFLVALSVIALPTGYWAWRHSAFDRDVSGRPYLEATVAVEAVTDLPPSKAGIARPHSLRLALAGRKVWAYSYLPIRPRQRVEVTYRIGRSGAVYVSGIALVPVALSEPGIGLTRATSDATRRCLWAASRPSPCAGWVRARLSFPVRPRSTGFL